MPAATATVIHWFRRDLRITDNLALSAAAESGLPVIPVYILSQWKESHHWTGPKRQHFLCGCLASLARNLTTIGGRMVIRQGEAVEELLRLVKESGANAIHFNSDPDPFGKETERRLRSACAEIGIECHSHADAALHQPDEILTQGGLPYRVYTPYSRNWLAQPKATPVSKPENLRTPGSPDSLPLPTLSTWRIEPPDGELLEPGEKSARQRMKQAIDQRVGRYGALRDLPAEEATSRLSQDLRFGLISIRTLYAKAMAAMSSASSQERGGIEIFIKELAWREFYFAILHQFPNGLDEEFNADWRGLPWDEPDWKFDAWKQGRTGFPIIDAGMRQLLATGFMHNRVRMITAMFLTKDLHIDWRHGESFFMQHLLDGEIASNNGGWQWSAGTGADAAPYFRIQNPWSQSSRYDPQGIYIKRWVPELAAVPAVRLMEPPKDGRPLVPGYPLPIVDHATERARTLAIFKKHREQAS
jgi:deoxyribodipyrimidine photo-lyase